ncbi:PP2C family protein-serine/threonine phosphatase [Verrucosispora sp. WMMD573]|uniref:PP2C family protein-serine/threonine phosphatase n=1 Tax=Verrucosispora sp. WMMD573 TaxID=3015149 RepID=UPI00248C178D|nr:PP2C family protein-serine/threonine phosphatase [Verrucosispora sp. WMMD573]WBB54778.1 PP2C family protein-serine/threonine phosphatase [Verrucosispora sp. WMMD573]
MTSTRPGTFAGAAGERADDGRSHHAATEVPHRTSPVDADLARELLDGLDEGVLTTDDAGLVALVNAMAGQLLPDIVVGTDLAGCPLPALAAASASGADDFEGEHHGRRLRGVRRALGGHRSAWYVRDVTDEHNRVAELLAERRRTQFLAGAGRRLGLALERDQALHAVATLPVPYLAELALVVHLPPTPTEYRPHWIRYAAGDTAPITGTVDWDVVAAVPGLVEALDGETTDPRPWPALGSGRLDPLLPAGLDASTTLLVSPMPGAGRTAGALVLLRPPERASFDRRDVELVRELVARAGAALATAQLHDEQSHLARVLQDSLLPPRLPTVAGVSMSGGYRAAGDSLRIGGDFYDVLPAGDGALFAVGDVSGKGVGAAVLTGRVRQSLQTLRLVEQQPRELLRLLDQALLDTPDAARRGQFTTLLLGAVRAGPQGGLRVRIAGGGHPAPLVIRATGTVSAIRVGGMPVGALPGARFASADVRLRPGELLFVRTDGVAEARGGPRGTETFGERRLRRTLAAGAGLPPATLVDRVLHEVDTWCAGHRHDDVAMLAIGPTGD